MFTGIVEEIGRITAVEPSGDGVRLTLHAPGAIEDVHHGDSIAVNGVCLTVVDTADGTFTGPVRHASYTTDGIRAEAAAEAGEAEAFSEALRSFFTSA